MPTVGRRKRSRSMWCSLVVVASITMAPNAGDDVPVKQGLSEDGGEKLKALLSAQDDPEQFKNRLQKLVA